MKAYIVVYMKNGRPYLELMTGKELKEWNRLHCLPDEDYTIVSGIVLKDFGQKYDIDQLVK